MTIASRRGPRPRGPFEDKRRTLTTRITDETRAHLETAAATSGRSLAQEIELRLDRSLQGERTLVEALEVAFGRQTAAVMLACGFALREAASTARVWSRQPLQIGEQPWLAAPFVFHQAAAAVGDLMMALKPEGGPESDKMPALTGLPGDLRELIENLGPAAAAKVGRAVAFPADDGPLGSWAAVIHNWLGKAAIGRIKDALAEPQSGRPT